MWIVWFLTLLVAFPAMATDMYLPALPTIQEQWGVSMTQANLSLVVFFVANSVMMLVYGPLSDRLGRKPVLRAGLLVFLLGSLGCAAAPGIWWLVAARTLQGMGAASATTLSMAITKDLWSGAERQRILGYIGVIFSLMPMLAPSLGSGMMLLGSWRIIFVLQASLAAVALVGEYCLAEPLKHKSSESLLKAGAGYVRLFGNAEFLVLVFVFSLTMLPLFTYIGGSPNIYIEGFGVSEQEFGLFFGLNALGLMAGSMLCARLAGKVSSQGVLWFSLAGMLVCGLALVTYGAPTAWAFTAVAAVNAVCMGINRPIANHIILETVETDVGAASSLTMFSFFTVGAFSIWLISLDWPSKIVVFAAMMIIGSAAPIITLLARRFVVGQAGKRAACASRQ